MGLVLAPILEGKLETWKSWVSEFKGSKQSEFAASNKRHGLTRQDVWLAETPGGPVAVVLHEGSGSDTFMQNLGQSEDPFDKSMVKSIMEMHGMDLKAPPPGPPSIKMT